MRNKRNSAKDIIIDTASRLFYKQGYHSTGITQIIAEADTVKATFYQHFPSKDALGEAYLRKRHAEWLGDLEAYLARYEKSAEKLLGIFEFLAQWLVREEFRGCAFLNITSEFPDAAHPIRGQVKAHKHTMQGYVQGLVAQMTLPEGKNKEVIARSIYLLAEGAIVESQVHGDAWPVATAKEAVKMLLS